MKCVNEAMPLFDLSFGPTTFLQTTVQPSEITRTLGLLTSLILAYWPDS